MSVNISTLINELEKLASREKPVSVADPIAISTALRAYLRANKPIDHWRPDIRAKLLSYLEKHPLQD